MKRKTVLTLVMCVSLAIGILPFQARAGVLFQEIFETFNPDESPGRFVPAEAGTGWQALSGGDSFDRAEYLRYPSGDVLSAKTGAISFELTRRNQEDVEAIFALADGEGNALFVAQIFWNGVFQAGTPELKFEGHRYPHRVWYTDRSDPKYGDVKVLPEVVTLKKVALGQKVRLAFTWGSKVEDCSVFLDGQKVKNVLVDLPFGMTPLIEASEFLVLGAEPLPGWKGGYSHTTSVISNFKSYDTSANPYIPEIRNVAHNAFTVAGYSGKLVNSDILTMELQAEPAGKAVFDIVEIQSTVGGSTRPRQVKVAGIPGVENASSPGDYTASYTVRYGDNVENGRVVGRFVSALGFEASPLEGDRPLAVDTRVFMAVKPSNDLIPADRSSRSGLTVTATDANGRKIRDHLLKLTLSTTDEYTGILGGSSFEDAVGGSLDVDWGGVTDSFGEVTAQLISGFAAKTMVVSARDMVSGDVGVGWVRSYIDGSVDIKVVPAQTSALSFAGSMELSASREWLTADGRSRSRITAVVKDASGNALSGHTVTFSLVGSNGSVKAIQSRTDSRGRAYADYVAGTKMGQVTIEVRDTTGGLFGSITVELRPDAPAKIALTAGPAEVYVGGEGTTVTAEVLDINDNPNRNVDVSYAISAENGKLSATRVATDIDGKASVQFTPGDTPGVVTVKGTVISRAPTAEEVSAAKGAVFLYGLSEDPGVLEVSSWLVEAGDEVTEDQDLATLTDRRGTVYAVKAPRDGEVSVFVAEEGDEIQYGDTLAYVIEVAK